MSEKPIFTVISDTISDTICQDGVVYQKVYHPDRAKPFVKRELTDAEKQRFCDDVKKLKPDVTEEELNQCLKEIQP